MIVTILNLFALFIATFAVLVFTAVFSFLLIYYVCLYLHWMAGDTIFINYGYMGED
jgi:hypothetical protein